ncbi:MAG: phosphoglycerate kinase, partial [Parcubacteria group bacterium]|nr:phosphoglycerate kinase [Parcubacteria group bacterium]
MRYISKINPKFLRGTALLRLDLNTEDDWRMKASLPIIKFLIRHADKVLILSHKGRPKGTDKKLSLRRDAARLQKLLKKEVRFIGRFDFRKIKRTLDNAPPKSILILENLRFMPGEEKNDAKFARSLARLGDFYVNDAFAVSHRVNASVAAITRFLPS